MRVSYEEFLITDRGMELAMKLDVRYDDVVGILIYHQPSGTLLSKEFIENNNKFIELEISRMNRNIESVEFAMEHKDYSVLEDLKDMYKFRSIAKEHLDEFRYFVSIMY